MKQEKKVKEKMPSLLTLTGGLLIPDYVEEVLEKEIKPFGRDGAHITGIDSRHVGKRARIIIKKKEEDKSKNK